MTGIVTPDDVVRVARQWIGTPYKHHGRVMGRACDCIGLVVGVGKKLGSVDYAKTNYSRYPTGQYLISEMEENLITAPPGVQPVAGMVAAIWYADQREPQHTAIISTMDERLMMIHAFNKKNAVVEHGLSDFWRDRIVKLFYFPGVTY